MKYFIVVTCALLLASCSRSPVNKFIDSHNQKNHTFSLTIPAWLVRTGTSSAFSDFIDEKDQKGFSDISKKLGKIRVFIANKSVVSENDVKQLIIDSRNSNYEEYFTVREKGKIVNVMVQQDKDRVKNLVVIINSEKDFVTALIEADISITELEDAQISWNKSRTKNKETI